MALSETLRRASTSSIASRERKKSDHVGMRQDWSWRRSAKQYVDLYLRRPARGNHGREMRSSLRTLPARCGRRSARLEAAVGRCAYNYVLHTTPFAAGDPAHFHWHWEIVPVIVRPAGFELGTGWFINPVPPETAAKTLREARG